MHQYINAITFKFVNNVCPYYLNGSTPLNADQNQEVTLPSSSFFFGKLTWDKKASHTLVHLYETIYPHLWKKPPFWILLNITWRSNILSIYGQARLDKIITGIYVYSLSIYLFIYLFICLFTYLFFFLFSIFLLLFFLFTISFNFSHNEFYIICYASNLSSHYVPNLLLLMLQYHYLVFMYLLHMN